MQTIDQQKISYLLYINNSDWPILSLTTGPMAKFTGLRIDNKYSTGFMGFKTLRDVLVGDLGGFPFAN